MVKVNRLLVEGREVATVTSVEMQDLNAGERVPIHFEYGWGVAFVQQLEDGRWRLQTDKKWYFEDFLSAFVRTRDLVVGAMRGSNPYEELKKGSIDVVVMPGNDPRYVSCSIFYHHRLDDVMKPLLPETTKEGFPQSHHASPFGLYREYVHYGHTAGEVMMHILGKMPLDLLDSIDDYVGKCISEEMLAEQVAASFRGRSDSEG